MARAARKLAEVIIDPVEPLINERAVQGSNNPPEPTPYEAAEKSIADLYDEAVLWMDGAPIDSQDLADGVSNLKAAILKAKKAAEDAKAIEKRPHLDANTAIEARYKPLIAKADMAVDACKKALTPWQIAEAARLEAEAAERRRIADEARKAAEAAIRASDQANLAERAAAEELLSDAKRAEQDASRAEKAKPLTGGVIGRRDTLITVYSATMTDPRAALNHFAKAKRDDLISWLQSMADAHVRYGQHSPDELPGFTITSEQKVR